MALTHHGTILPTAAHPHTGVVECVLQATSISSALVPSVRSASFRATVHSVFEHVVNLVSGDGRLVSVIAQELGNFPHGILVADAGGPLLSLGWKEGMLAFGTGDGAVRLPEAHMVLSLNGASVWSASARVGPMLTVDGIGHNLSVLESVALARNEGAGLSLLIPHWKAILCDQMPPEGEMNALGRAARGPLLKLLRGIRSGDRAASLRSARDLIGLGVGFTPSGDDVLVGLMAGLLSLGDRAGAAKGFSSLAQDMSLLARGRTTLISQAFLQHAANNETSEMLRDLIRSVLTASGVEVASSASRVLRIGSSSGVELILGVLLGIGLGLESLDEEESVEGG